MDRLADDSFGEAPSAAPKHARKSQPRQELSEGRLPAKPLPDALVADSRRHVRQTPPPPLRPRRSGQRSKTMPSKTQPLGSDNVPDVELPPTHPFAKPIPASILPSTLPLWDKETGPRRRGSSPRPLERASSRGQAFDHDRMWRRDSRDSAASYSTVETPTPFTPPPPLPRQSDGSVRGQIRRGSVSPPPLLSPWSPIDRIESHTDGQGLSICTAVACHKGPVSAPGELGFGDTLDRKTGRKLLAKAKGAAQKTAVQVATCESLCSETACKSPSLFSLPPSAKVFGDEGFDMFSLPTSTRVKMAAEQRLLDSNGKVLTFGDLLPDNTDTSPLPPRTLAIFLRHFWCGHCQDYVTNLEKRIDSEAIKAANVRLVFICHGSPRVMKGYQKLFKVPYPLYTDPSPNNDLYRLLGMTLQAKLKQPRFERPEYNLASPQVQAARGAMNGITKLPIGAPGSWKQLGGELLFGPGYACEFAHRMYHMGDHWEVGFILRAAGVLDSDSAATTEELQAAKTEAYRRFHIYYQSPLVDENGQVVQAGHGSDNTTPLLSDTYAFDPEQSAGTVSVGTVSVGTVDWNLGDFPVLKPHA